MEGAWQADSCLAMFTAKHKSTKREILDSTLQVLGKMTASEIPLLYKPPECRQQEKPISLLW